MSIESRIADTLSALDALEDGAHALQMILDDCPWPLIVGNAERWLAVSKSFAVGLGYSRREIHQIPWQDLVVPDAQPALVDELEAAARDEVTGYHVVAYRHRKGHIRRIEFAWSPVNDSGYNVAVGRFL